MVRLTSILAGALLAMVFTAAPGSAQMGISLEGRGGYNFPLGDFEDAGAESKYGFGADVMLSVHDAFSVYGGWGRDEFDCENCGPDDHYFAQGFEAGLKLLMPREEGMLPWIRLGGTYHELGGEVSGQDLQDLSDAGFGFQASAGVDIPLTEALYVTPAARFQTFSAELDQGFGVISAEQDVQYLSLDLALHYHLPRWDR